MLTLNSRYGTKRVFKIITEDTVEFIAYETLYYTGTGNREDLYAIDPDGGPFIQKGSNISLDTGNYTVVKFENIEFDEEKEVLKVLIKVKKEE